MNISMRTSVSAAAFAAVFSAAVGTALAAETINLTAVSGYAPTASWVKIFEEYFIPQVDKALAEKGDYVINWNKGFSGTVVKPRGELDAVSSGVADLAIVVPAFHVDKLPLHAVSFVTPFATGDLHLVTRAMSKIAEEVPEFTQEWSDLGVHYIGPAGSVDNYEAVCKTNKPNPKDFDGVKIAGAGTNLLYFKGVGGVGVNSNLGDFYNAMQTGIAECSSVWAEAAAGFKLYEVAPYFIKADMGAVTSFAIAANETYWETLPEPVKEAIEEATAGYGTALADYVVAAADASLETYKANGGTIVQYTQEQRQEMAAGMPNIAKEWAEAADKAGKPGSKILTMYMDMLRANDQEIAREWDKE
ncbi:C4-dicarboxylate TRAP transporter substrate-binding protein [Aquibium sp. LZ166]|uniref:C4-dicarboxylate TRAP transporter substrate-binding protein n=1 Tax=Aquibium pacificus TaxID=3153579 RepID=A0ABV3SM61_9HYPH